MFEPVEKQITRTVGWGALALIACCSPLHASVQSLSDETTFQQSVGPITVESFDQFPTGFLPQTTLQLGDVTVTLTNSGTAPIFGPGFGGFTTNFLSIGVQDGGNNVLITFPTGTVGAGLKLVSVYPITVTATASSGESNTVTFSSSEVAFLGFVADSTITQIRISSVFIPQLTPIVNIGDISYAIERSGADSDGDGVPDNEDQCPGTSPGAIVNAAGCSIDQLAPCVGPRSGGTWKNHGHYVSAVARAAEAFLAAGLLTGHESGAIVAAAAQSNCGKW